MNAVVSTITAGAAGVITGEIVSSNLHGQTSVLHKQQTLACHRLNVHRNADNKNNYALWRIIKLVESAGSQQAVQQQTPKGLYKDYFNAISDDEKTQTWTPLTPDCSHNQYKTQTPVQFSDREPTKSDLTLKKGE